MVNVHTVHTHQTTVGVGVPLVGWKNTTPVGVKRAPFLLPNGLPYLLTATLTFDRPGPPIWHFIKRWLHEDLMIGRHLPHPRRGLDRPQRVLTGTCANWTT